MIKIIVATAKNGIIGSDGKMPWNQKTDLQRFKSLTSGSVVIMGRKTFESIGRLLPNRINVVLTENTEKFLSENPEFNNSELAFVFSDLLDAVETFRSKGREVFIIGGGTVYRQAIKIADVVYLTEIDCEVDGDTTFEKLTDDWQLVASEKHPADANNDYPYDFKTFMRP